MDLQHDFTFAESDMTGIRRFLFDMSMYVRAYHQADPPV